MLFVSLLLVEFVLLGGSWVQACELSVGVELPVKLLQFPPPGASNAWVFVASAKPLEMFLGALRYVKKNGCTVQA